MWVTSHRSCKWVWRRGGLTHVAPLRPRLYGSNKVGMRKGSPLQLRALNHRGCVCWVHHAHVMQSLPVLSND